MRAEAASIHCDKREVTLYAIWKPEGLKRVAVAMASVMGIACVISPPVRAGTTVVIPIITVVMLIRVGIVKVSGNLVVRVCPDMVMVTTAEVKASVVTVTVCSGEGSTNASDVESRVVEPAS